MRRRLLWSKLLISAAFIAGISPGAFAQDYEADTANPLITTVSPEGETQLTANKTWEIAVSETDSTTGYQTGNREYYAAKNWLGTLIDGNDRSFWRSSYDVSPRSGNSYIQIDLKRTDLKEFMLYMNRAWYDDGGNGVADPAPRKAVLKATNTPDDENSWTVVATFNDLKPSSVEGAWPVSKYVDMKEPYRYVRLYCLWASVAEHYDNGMWALSELQVYPAKKIADSRAILSSICDSLAALDRDYVTGTEIGCVDENAYNVYFNAWGEAMDLVADSKSTQEQCAAKVVELRQAIAAVTASVVLPKDGYYFVRSGYTEFSSNDLTINWYSSGGQVRYTKASDADATQYFKIERQADGNYSIYSPFRKLYVKSGEHAHYDAYWPTNQEPIKMTPEQETAQIITPLYNGNFLITNAFNADYPYIPLSGSATTTKGQVEQASYSSGIAEWTFVAADSTKMEEAIATVRHNQLQSAVIDSIQSARKRVISVKNPAAGLITDVSQLSDNCSWSQDGNLSFLLDHNTNTHFHSIPDFWQTEYLADGVTPKASNIFNQDEWLQVDTKRDDLKSIILEHWGRTDGQAANQAWHDTPTKYDITGTNTPDDESSWAAITTLSGHFPGNIHGAHYVSPTIKLDTPYRYLRFHIRATSSGNSYWNLSEFQLFDEIPAAESSLYTVVPEAKAAIDKIEATALAAEEKANESKADSTDLQALQAAMDELTELLNSQQKVKDAVAAAQALNKKLYTFRTDGYIKEVNTHNDGTNQLTSPATWLGLPSGDVNYQLNKECLDDGYNFLGTLIDNNDQTYWHSNPGGNFVGADNWYNIDLKTDTVTQFRVRVDRRNDPYWNYTKAPYSADVYGTNDASLWENVSSATSSWTKLASIVGAPDYDDYSKWPNVSQDIKTATPYRYLRYVPTAIIGGLPYWGISGFQIIQAGDSAYDAKKSQYLRVDGMKEAADNMMSVVDEVQAKLDNGTATIADVPKIEAAMKAVEDLYQDTGANDSILKWAHQIADNAEIGDELGQFSDETVVTALKDAITAVEEGSSNTATFKANSQALADAVENAKVKVNGVQTGKWFYILSATAAGDAAPESWFMPRSEVKGTALYINNNGGSDGKEGLLGTYSIANNGELHWGMDDHKGIEREGDPDAIWQFIPAPESFGPRAYYLRNLRTGWYAADRGGNQVFVSHTPQAFRVDFVGGRSFHIVALEGNYANSAICFDNIGRRITLATNGLGLNNRFAFELEQFNAAGDEQVKIPFANNTAQIITLPFAVKDFSINSEAAYGIHSIVDETHIGLEQKSEFAGGEAMIIVLGDTTATDHPATYLYFDVPDVLTDVDTTVNGLVSSFDGTTLSTVGDAYIEGNVLKAVTGNANISTFSGYIAADKVVNKEGEPDAVLEIAGEGVINKVGKVQTAIDANAPVNVYTIDGQLVKKNVKAAQATKGLRKGVYIVGKKKVLVK